MSASFLLFAAVILLWPQAPRTVLPEGQGAWLVEVATSGGIVGTGIGDFAISSEGKIACSGKLTCPDQFSLSDFQPLVEAFQNTILPLPAPVTVFTFCNDCLRRTITITHRDLMGVLHTYTASWDETTRSQIPAQVLRIHDSLVALARPRDAR